MEIKIKLSHSESQMKDFFRFHLMRRSPSRYVYFTFALSLLIVGLIFFMLRRPTYAIFFFFVAILVLITRRITVNSTISKIMKSLSKNSLRYSLLFKEDSLNYEATNNIKSLKYVDLLEVYEYKRYLYFYYNKDGAFILNLDNINEEQYVTIKKYLIDCNKYKKSKIV